MCSRDIGAEEGREEREGMVSSAAGHPRAAPSPALLVTTTHVDKQIDDDLELLCTEREVFDLGAALKRIPEYY